MQTTSAPMAWLFLQENVQVQYLQKIALRAENPFGPQMTVIGTIYIFCVSNFLLPLRQLIFRQKQPGHWGRGCLPFSPYFDTCYFCENGLETMGFNSPSLNPENCRLNGDRKSHYVRKKKQVHIVTAWVRMDFLHEVQFSAAIEAAHFRQVARLLMPVPLPFSPSFLSFI